MTAVTPLLQLPAPAAARQLALEFLDSADRALRRLDEPPDAEALHDFRVALRRLRSCIREYRPHLQDTVRRKDVRRIRRLARSTGAGRDQEVKIAWLKEERENLAGAVGQGLDWLIETLESDLARERAALHASLPPAFRTMRKRLLRRLSRYCVQRGTGGFTTPPCMLDVLRAVTGAAAVELRSRVACVETIAHREEAHRARIAGKRLRYLLEPHRREERRFREPVKQLKQLQDLLGDLRDLELLLLEVELARKSLCERGDQRGESLEGLQRHLTERQEVVYSEFERFWRGPPAEAFFADLEARLGASGTADLAGVETEIERKYLLARMPTLPEPREHLEVEQGWLPGEKLQERLRRVSSESGVRCSRTVKHGTGVQRLELEEATSEELFAALWPLTEGRRVHKTRVKVPWAGLVWEIDSFQDRALVLAEVELPTVDTPVDPPAWLAPHIVREVTGESEFLNVNLAR